MLITREKLVDELCVMITYLISLNDEVYKVSEGKPFDSIIDNLTKLGYTTRRGQKRPPRQYSINITHNIFSVDVLTNRLTDGVVDKVIVLIRKTFDVYYCDLQYKIEATILVERCGLDYTITIQINRWSTYNPNRSVMIGWRYDINRNGDPISRSYQRDTTKDIITDILNIVLTRNPYNYGYKLFYQDEGICEDWC